MTKVVCEHHRDRKIKPVMICFGRNSLGKQYICAVCSGVRQFNSGRIISFDPVKRFGFINGVKENIYFHFNNLAYDFRSHKGMLVSYEIQFLDGDRKQAINIKPSDGGENGY